MTIYRFGKNGIMVAVIIVLLAGLGRLFPEPASSDLLANPIPPVTQQPRKLPVAENIQGANRLSDTQSRMSHDAVSNEATIDRLIDRSQTHADMTTRLAAIAAMGSLPGTKVDLVLRSLLDDPEPSFREEAVESIAVLRGPTSVADLGYALSDENAMVRRLAVMVLAEADNDEATAALALTLGDPDPAVRKFAVDELAAVGSETASLVLQGFLSDTDRQVRARAMQYRGDTSM